MIKLIFQKELILIEQMNRKNVSISIYCHYQYFLNKNFSYVPFTCDGCYDIVQGSTDFKNIAVVHIKKTAYRIYFQHMSKHKAKKIMNKFDLIGKTGSIYCND